MTTEKVLRPVSDRHFRDVLGHLPTGVVVVTALAADGAPVGMAVGSFTSVSLDPPLVAFFPDKSSSTFPRLRESSSFCVNILAADQGEVCRRFATKGADKFADTAWKAAPSGAPVLDGVVAWIDCDFESVQEAGDHLLVLGRVSAMDVSRPTIPLLFFQGGYGAFAARAIAADERHGMERQIRLADHARAELDAVSDELDVEMRAAAIVDGRQVVIAVSQPQGAAVWHTAVGISLPFLPPWGASYKAWAGDAEIRAWCDAARPALDADRRAALHEELALIRRYGWSVKHRDDDDLMQEIDDLEQALEELGQTPVLERRLAEAVSRLSPHADPSTLDERSAARVLSIAAPVFDADGEVAMILLAWPQPNTSTLARVRTIADRVIDAAAATTARIGGSAPASYRVIRPHDAEETHA
jgi:flavin reductase (DIM6/NTAB) family NADH-FMN oxidoreductase RutF/DNA-binding IclR family transcriptional regulator